MHVLRRYCRFRFGHRRNRESMPSNAPMRNESRSTHLIFAKASPVLPSAIAAGIPLMVASDRFASAAVLQEVGLESGVRSHTMQRFDPTLLLPTAMHALRISR